MLTRTVYLTRIVALMALLVSGCIDDGTYTGDPGGGGGGYSYQPTNHQIITGYSAEVTAGRTWDYEFAIPAGLSATVEYTVEAASDEDMTACIVPTEEIQNIYNGSLKCYAPRSGKNGGALSDQASGITGTAAVAVRCDNLVFTCSIRTTIYATY